MDNLTNLLNLECNNYHTICLDISSLINQYHKNNVQINNQIFEQYINFLKHNSCFTSYEHINIITKILEYTTVDEDTLTSIIIDLIELTSDENIIINLIFDTIINRKYSIKNSIIKKLIRHNKINLVAKLLNYDNTEKNEKTLELLCNIINHEKPCQVGVWNYSHYIYDEKESKFKDSLVKKLLKHKIKITPKAILYCINNKRFNLANYLIKNGKNPDHMCLKQACYWRDIETIEMILWFKILPTNRCFQLLFPLIKPHWQKEHPESPEVAKAVDILVKYGYQIDYEDVVFATKRYCRINMLQRYYIKLDAKYLEICYGLKYFPYGHSFCKPTNACLYNECDDPDIKNIKRMVDQGVKIDQKCLEILCKKRSNFSIVRWIFKNSDIKSNWNCLNSIVSDMNNKTLQYVVKNFKHLDGTVEKSLNKELEQLCILVKQKNGLKKVKEFIDNTGLEPDIHCLREACKLKANLRIVKYLVEDWNLLPDSISLKNIVSNFNVPILKMVMEHFDIV